MKIAVLGSGIVGETLANGFLKYGHEVMRGSRDPQKLSDWKSKSGAHALTGTFSEAAKFGTLIVLAVKGDTAESVIHLAGPENLKGKTIIDTSNPIGNVPPTNGVLNFFTNINFSLMEGLQKQVLEAHFVKAFSCVGSAFMVNPQFEGGKPSMFICGNDAASKKTVAEILIQFGWDVEDMGMAESARAIEPLCMLWCIPGLAHNQWSHAFKLLKK